MQLRQNAFDVLIAPAAERAAVESGANTLNSPPEWVPVFDTRTGDLQAVRADYGRGVSSEDDVRSYLKAIHKSLKSQGR